MTVVADVLTAGGEPPDQTRDPLDTGSVEVKPAGWMMSVSLRRVPAEPASETLNVQLAERVTLYAMSPEVEKLSACVPLHVGEVSGVLPPLTGAQLFASP